MLLTIHAILVLKPFVGLFTLHPIAAFTLLEIQYPKN